MLRGNAYAQIMRVCADNAPSTCLMCECVLCADHTQMRIVGMVRMCACAVLRSMSICAPCASAHVRCCAVCAGAELIAQKPQRLYFPLYSRAGEQIERKSLLFNHLRRKLLLNDMREVWPCHTFQTDATKIFTPEGVKIATHAQRHNSCRFGACPTMPKDHPCHARRRQEPCKNLAIITIRPRIGLVRVVNYRPCQPNAGAPATPEKKQRNRAKTPHPPGPPKTLRNP